MMRHISIAFLLGLMVFTPPLSSADEGTAEQAQALVEKAIARYKEAGVAQTISEVNDPKGPFVDGELYVFVVGPDKKVVGHGADSTRIGETMVGSTDTKGKVFGDEILAATPEGVWVDYYFKNYATGADEQKSSFIKKVDDYIIGSGYYKQ